MEILLESDNTETEDVEIPLPEPENESNPLSISQNNVQMSAREFALEHFKPPLHWTLNMVDNCAFICNGVEFFVPLDMMLEIFGKVILRLVPAFLSSFLVSNLCLYFIILTVSCWFH
jgi:hypothetical protein